ncbi:MAG: hypothetical protein LBG73_08675 [Spirochaetaceae bacterium]|nr:hypothetical protein [Spirochaetaceae bacterium]
MLKAFMASGEGVTVNDEKHSITMTQNQPAEPITDNDLADMLAQDLQINQKRTPPSVLRARGGQTPHTTGVRLSAGVRVHQTRNSGWRNR